MVHGRQEQLPSTMATALRVPVDVLAHRVVGTAVVGAVVGGTCKYDRDCQTCKNSTDGSMILFSFFFFFERM